MLATSSWGPPPSAAGHMHPYALWFIRVRTRFHLPYHIPLHSYSPPFLCVCTRRRSFIIPAVHLRPYTAHPRSHTPEPPSCMPPWPYALHGLFIQTPGHFTTNEPHGPLPLPSDLATSQCMPDKLAAASVCTGVHVVGEGSRGQHQCGLGWAWPGALAQVASFVVVSRWWRR